MTYILILNLRYENIILVFVVKIILLCWYRFPEMSFLNSYDRVKIQIQKIICAVYVYSEQRSQFEILKTGF